MSGPEKFKPCPICGYESILIQECWFGRIRAFCPECGFRGPKCRDWHEMFRKWNRRPDYPKESEE